MFFKLTSFLLLSAALCANPDTAQSEVAKVSKAFGQLIGKNLDALGVDYDLELVIKGLKEAKEGSKNVMSETECIAALTHAQEQAFEKQANNNLAKAEAFLKDNAKVSDVVVLEEGKLQYKVEKQGKGPSVANDSSPLVRYVGKYLDGTEFGSSEGEETISLTDSIRGISKGILGMKEGEKRTIYIHPDFGFGTEGLIPPNSLLTVDVELVKADHVDDLKEDGLIIDSFTPKATAQDPPAIR